MRKPSPVASLRLLQAEPVFSHMSFATPIFTVFYLNEIGMIYFEIGLAQAAYTVVLMVCQIPAGRIADLFSRKWCNVGGNLIAAIAFVAYAHVDRLAGVIVAECVVGIGLSFSDGADTALRRYYAAVVAQNEDDAEFIFAGVCRRIARITRIGRAFAFAVGGWVGATNPRLAITFVAVAFTVAAVIVLFVPDIPKSKPEHEQRSVSVVKVTWQDKRLRWRMLALAFSSQASIVMMMLLFTPLLMAGGASAGLIGISWVLSIVAEYCGARATGYRKVKEAKRARQYSLVVIVFISSSIWLVFGVHILTVLPLLGIALVIGWIDAMAEPTIIEALENRENVATVMSVHRTLEAIAYSVLAIVIGTASLAGPHIGALVGLAIFVGCASLIWTKLRRYG